MSQNTPNIINIPDPVLLDRAIANIQQKLSSITWLSAIYGRAFRFEEQVPEVGRVVYPKSFSGQTLNKRDANYTPLVPNDTLQSYCFFYPIDNDSIVNDWDYSRGSNNIFKRDLALIFWVDLQKIDPLKNYVHTENLRLDVMNALKGLNRLQVKNYEDRNFKEVFKEFDFQKMTDRLNLRYPYSGMRFEFSISYDERGDCI